MTENQIRHQLIDQYRALLQLWPDVEAGLRLTMRFNRGAGDGLLATPAQGIVGRQPLIDDIVFLAPGSTDDDWQCQLHRSLPQANVVLTCAPDHTAQLVTTADSVPAEIPVKLNAMQSVLGKTVRTVTHQQSIATISAALSDGRSACLLAETGMVVTGDTPGATTRIAVQLERLARLSVRHLTA